jgi:hypothetical protein
MNKHRVIEIICVVFLICFIFLISMEDAVSDKTVKEVAEAVSMEINIGELSSFKKNKVKKEFGIDFDGIDSFVYYASDSVMNVEELLVIKLKEGAKADSITEKIETRVKDKQVLFEGYAPEQSALLKNYVLSVSHGFIFYVVGEEATDALILFNEIIR